MSERVGTEPFVARLALDQVDRDIFTGWCHAGAPLRAFGGQVAAQALVAAGSTLEGDEPRRVHSLHAYFLRAGRTTDKIVYLVDRPHDGRSYTTRRVRAVQYGETIFTMSASFALPEAGLEHQSPSPTVPPPQECEPADFAWLSEATDRDGPLLEVRRVPTEAVTESTSGRLDGGLWVRIGERLPDDSLTHVCALTYISDLQLAGSALRPHRNADGSYPRVAIASLDHAMWFHSEFRADEWLLFITGSPVAGSGRGLNLGEIYSAEGTLIASAVQESLMRLRG